MHLGCLNFPSALHLTNRHLTKSNGLSREYVHYLLCAGSMLSIVQKVEEDMVTAPWSLHVKQTISRVQTHSMLNEEMD